MQIRYLDGLTSVMRVESEMANNRPNNQIAGKGIDGAVSRPYSDLFSRCGLRPALWCHAWERNVYIT